MRPHAFPPLLVVAATVGVDVCSVPSNNVVLNDEELRYVKGIHRPRLFPPSAERKQLAAEVLPASKALWQVGELPHLGSLAVQGQNLSDRSAESLQNGFTQILNGLEAFVPFAAALAATIAKQTALASVLVTAYNHPLFGQPVCAHADAQDTFILQLEGCRVWQYWHHSLGAQHLVQDPTNRSSELCIKHGTDGQHGSVHVELHPGAILWLPRGIAHQTSRCGNGISSHWSFAASLPKLSAGHILKEVAQASAKQEVQDRLLHALGKDNELNVRLRQGHPSLETIMAMLDEVSPGAWPALDRRLVAQRLKDLENSVPELSISQMILQCRAGPLGKFLIRRRHVDL